MFIFHKPGCLVEKTVLEPAGPGFEASGPFTRWQKLKQSVVGVRVRNTVVIHLENDRTPQNMYVFM